MKPKVVITLIYFSTYTVYTVLAKSIVASCYATLLLAKIELPSRIGEEALEGVKI